MSNVVASSMPCGFTGVPENTDGSSKPGMGFENKVPDHPQCAEQPDHDHVSV